MFRTCPVSYPESTRAIARRPQQQTGADQQRERERRLAHRHEVQEAALAAAGAAFWPAP